MTARPNTARLLQLHENIKLMPWHMDHDENGVTARIIVYDPEYPDEGHYVVAADMTPADAAYAVEAANLAPALARRCEALEAAIRALLTAEDRYCHHEDCPGSACEECDGYDCTIHCECAKREVEQIRAALEPAAGQEAASNG